MSLNYQSLDPVVRVRMLEELSLDESNGAVYLSPRLTAEGVRLWPGLLRSAFEKHDDAWLAAELRRLRLIRETEPRRTSSGGTTSAKVPHTAADTLAEGEFNRFYARGLCADVVHAGGGRVEVYRAKAVQTPRPQSSSMIGRTVDAGTLLADLRTSQGVEPALGLPPGPNSGLSVRRSP